jgi:hypothetical protein
MDLNASQLELTFHSLQAKVRAGLIQPKADETQREDGQSNDGKPATARARVLYMMGMRGSGLEGVSSRIGLTTTLAAASSFASRSFSAVSVFSCALRQKLSLEERRREEQPSLGGRRSRMSCSLKASNLIRKLCASCGK